MRPELMSPAEPQPRTGSSPTVPAPGRRPYFPGLDGLRAIAVLLVIAYHLVPTVLPGGFVGVDIFFVISGFLITDQLRHERLRTNRIDLRRFWRNRARRLLPALAALMLLGVIATVFIQSDTGVGLRTQLLGVASFSSNWIDVSHDTDYFSADTRPLFQNLWSLAVEEQFYLLWPVIFAAGAVLLASRRFLRFSIGTGLTLLALALPALLLLTGATPSRVYFGTDTHSYALLIGAMLAFIGPARADRLAGSATVDNSRIPQPWWSRLRIAHPDLISGTALVAIAVAAATLKPTAPLTFAVFLPLVCLLTAVLIWAITSPTARWVRFLEAAPVRLIGRRSYGLYLWHWPVFVLVCAAANAPAGTPTSIPRLVIILLTTFLLAGLSYRYLEQPIMRDGFRATISQWSLRCREQRTVVQVSIAVALVAVICCTTAGVLIAPTSTIAEQLIRAAQHKLDISTATPTQSTEPLTPPTLIPIPGRAPLPTPAATPSSAPRDFSAPVLGSEITAIGDSVMLASAGVLVQKFPGISIDAVVSRQTSEAAAIIQSLSDSGALRRVLLIGLGTNGLYRPGNLAAIEKAAGPGHEIILVNAFGPRSWTEGVNAQIAAAAIANPNIAVANWNERISGHLDLLAPDQIHPSTAGATLYAEAVIDAFTSWASHHRPPRFAPEP